MPNFINKHLPLVTNRVEFAIAPPPVLPSITQRVEFTPARLAYRQDPRGAASPPPENDADHPPTTKRRQKRIGSKIAKPAGEPGRPNSGGFCVEAALRAHGWSKQGVQDLREAIREAAQEHLDMTVSYRKQRKSKLKQICEEMLQETRWPELKNYVECWPVHCLLKLILKYGAESARRAADRASARRVRAALRGDSPVRDED